MNTSSFKKLSFKTAEGFFTLYWDDQGLRATSLGQDKKKNDPPPPWIKKIQKRVEAYYKRTPKGKNDNFLDIPLYFEKKTPFKTKVYEVVRHIPSGKVLSYKEVAKKSGSPLACRAIGQIMARNPFPLLIPCHRVVGSGKVGGFSGQGGVLTKIKMLNLES